MLSLLVYLIIIVGLVLWLESEGGAPKKRPAEELDEWLKKFQWGSRSQISEKLDLPSYKFYSEVIETLLSLARRMGGNYQEAILFLRDGLQSDRQFEKKMSELKLGATLQMLLIMLLTWAFMLGALSLVEVKISWAKLGLVLGWQILGLLLLPGLIAYFRQRLFADMGVLWKMLYVLSSLARVPLSRREIFQLAGVQSLEVISQKSLNHLVEKLKQTCREALKQGGSYEAEVKYLMEELRFQEKWHCELFEKRLGAIKLGLLALFFLPAYLSFIFLLLEDLMTLM